MKERFKLRNILPYLSEDIKEGLSAVIKDVENADFYRKSAISQTEELQEGERAVIQYVSTRDIDRDNEILMPSGCILSEFKKAPQVLWGHNYAMPPIGKDEWIKADEKGIKAKTIYAPTERGEECWILRKGGFLKTSSVGFVPVEATSPGADDWDKTCKKLEDEWPEFAKVKDKVRRIIKKWLLLEHSDVSVPANINALTLAVAKGSLAIGDNLVNELGIAEQVAEVKSVVAKENKEPELTQEQKDAITKQAESDEQYNQAESWTYQKPFPNEHACRIKNPNLFQEDSFRRIARESDGKKFFIIIGRLKGETTTTEQAYRYPKDSWTVSTAREHCKSHNGMMFEPAREENNFIRYYINRTPAKALPEQEAEIKDTVNEVIDRLKGRV